jgi:hypothetical protein
MASAVMNTSIQSARLTLLMVDAAPDIGSRFQSLLDNDSEISLAHEGLSHGQVTEIIYRGVAFMVSIDENSGKSSESKAVFCNLETSVIRCGLTIELGAHVAGGERVPAIIQALLGVAAKLGMAFNAVAAVWHPVGIVSDFAYFSQAVSGYLAGGAFPVLAMVDFKVNDKGQIDSAGLALLSGQELRVSNSDMDHVEMIRRVVRVVHDIAVNGPVEVPVTLQGIEPDEILELEPSPDKRLLLMQTRSTLTASIGLSSNVSSN